MYRAQWGALGEEDFFTRVYSDRTGRSGFTEDRIRSDVRIKLFSVRVVRQCSRLPQEPRDGLSLAVLKARLYGDLSSLVQWKMSLSWENRLERYYL